MKKTISLILLTIFLLSCSHEDNILSPLVATNFRKVAYESLSQESKASLTNCWCVAPVKSGRYKFENGKHIISINKKDELHFMLNNPITNLESNQRLIAIIFNTKQDALLGPLIVIIDPNSELVIGYLARL